MMHAEYNNPKYVASYEDLYIKNQFWSPKYQCNRKIISEILTEQKPEVWLDLFCGQAQYFQLADKTVHCIGIDLAEEQIRIAKRKFPGHTFLIRDLRMLNLSRHLTDIPFITVMWGAYAYFKDSTEIKSLIENISAALCSGGIFYMEVIEPSSLANFNATVFASQNNTSVQVENAVDGSRHWSYRDQGSIHQLFCPSLNWFLEELAKTGIQARSLATAQTMHQLIGVKTT
jgi:hypothetical protein